MKILVADDSKTARHSLRTSLEKWGFEVIEAVDGDEAWSLLGGPNPPRIAIIDWMMPGTDGLELCRRLQQRSRGPLVYTILLTSRREEQDLVQALEAGAHSFLSKPTSEAALRSYINVGRRLVESDDKRKLSERTLRLVIESVAEGILIFSPEPRLVDANQRAVEMFGMDPNDYGGFLFSPLYPKSIELRESSIFQAILSGGEFRDEWTKGPTAEKAPQFLEVYCRGMVLEGQNFLLCVVRDITRSKHEEGQRLHAEKLNAAMETAGAACHELNQPLQAMLTGLEVGLMHTDDGSEINGRLLAIREACLRMAGITRQLQRITDYQTKQYIGEKIILDLDRSTR